MERTARCACGQFSITLEGDPIFAVACACSACRRRTGSVIGVSIYFPREALRRQIGTASRYSRLSEAGRPVEAHFCPDCGSTVYWYAAFRPDQIGVALGTLDAPVATAPQAAVWAAELPNWLHLDPSIASYDAGTGR